MGSSSSTLCSGFFTVDSVIVQTDVTPKLMVFTFKTSTFMYYMILKNFKKNSPRFFSIRLHPRQKIIFLLIENHILIIIFLIFCFTSMLVITFNLHLSVKKIFFNKRSSRQFRNAAHLFFVCSSWYFPYQNFMYIFLLS